MVSVLLDTCVLSELQRPQGHPHVRARVEELNPADLMLSVVTLGELVKGVSLLSAGARKRQLSSWLMGLEQQFAHQILPVDVEVARLWGEIAARGQRAGVQIPASDGLIAATALRHGLHVMTRNTKHFAASGVPVIDPWE